MGMVFAVMVHATGSILVSVIPHFIVNGSQVLLTYFMYGESGHAQDLLDGTEISRMVDFDSGYFTILLIVAVVFLIPAVILLRKMVSVNLKKDEEAEYEGEIGEAAEDLPVKRERMFTVPFFVILGFYIYYITMDINQKKSQTT